MHLKIIAWMALAITLSACGPQTDKTAAVSSEPPFPSFTVDELLELSKNERQELERRCLGLSNKTCSDLKSDGFKKRFDLNMSLCKLGAAQTGLQMQYLDRRAGVEAERKCDNM